MPFKYTYAVYTITNTMHHERLMNSRDRERSNDRLPSRRVLEPDTVIIIEFML